jgi:hypothetical protein
VSTLLYGKLVRLQETRTTTIAQARAEERKLAETIAAVAAEESKLAKTIAAIIPAEIIALHGFLLSLTTTTGAEETTIHNAGLLGAFLPVFLILPFILYFIGTTRIPKAIVDLGRPALVALAVLCWFGVIGISSLTPWVTRLGLNSIAVAAGAATVGVIVDAWNQAINKPPTPPGPTASPGAEGGSKVS